MVVPSKICPHKPGTCECHLMRQNEFLYIVKDLKVRQSSWIIQVGPKPRDKCPCKRKARERQIFVTNTEARPREDRCE